VGRDWLDRHTSQAPTALRARVMQYGVGASGPSLPQSLVAASQTALDRALSHPNDRSGALDLLAADALITLALLAQAETAPDSLEELAISILVSSRTDA
jgi:hypothetical protein